MSVLSRTKLLKKLRNKQYRDAYAVEHVQTSLPFQIRALREHRGWTQQKLAKEAKTTQTAISRTEDPNYGKLSLNTLYRLASAFDVALLVKFVPYSRLLDEFKDVSPEALAADSFEAELPRLERAALRWETVTKRSISATPYKESVRQLKLWHASHVTETPYPFTLGTRSKVIETLDRKVPQTIKITSTDRGVTLPYIPPPQSTMLDYTSGLPF